MIGQRAYAGLAFAAALLGMTACEAGPGAQSAARQDIDFARGCWVSMAEPGGKVTGFLRLLPPSIDAPTIEGQLQDVAGASTSRGVKLVVARDGSEMRVEAGVGDDWLVGVYRSAEKLSWTPPMRMSYRALFVAQTAQHLPRIVIFEGEKDALRIAWTSAPASDALIVVVVFEGERDGCD